MGSTSVARHLMPFLHVYSYKMYFGNDFYVKTRNDKEYNFLAWVFLWVIPAPWVCVFLMIRKNEKQSVSAFYNLIIY